MEGFMEKIYNEALQHQKSNEGKILNSFINSFIVSYFFLFIQKTKKQNYDTFEDEDEDDETYHVDENQAKKNQDGQQRSPEDLQDKYEEIESHTDEDQELEEQELEEQDEQGEVDEYQDEEEQEDEEQNDEF